MVSATRSTPSGPAAEPRSGTRDYSTEGTGERPPEPEPRCTKKGLNVTFAIRLDLSILRRNKKPSTTEGASPNPSLQRTIPARSRGYCR
jgi:hypothetical protein